MIFIPSISYRNLNKLSFLGITVFISYISYPNFLYFHAFKQKNLEVKVMYLILVTTY